MEVDETSADSRSWSPEIPLWAVVSGRVFLGILECLALWAIVAVVSKIVDLGLSGGSAFSLAFIAVFIREALDATCMRLIMRIRRSQDFMGAAATFFAFMWPIVAGAVASLVIRPDEIIVLTLIVWIMFALVVVMLEKPWDKSKTHEEMKRRTRAVRVMTRGVFAEEVEDGRINLPPLPDEDDPTEGAYGRGGR